MNDPIVLTEPQAKAQHGFGPLGIALLIAVVVVAIVFGLGLMRRNQAQPQSGLAPDFTLTTLTGETLKLSALRGKVVVVNFWASWCGPCRSEAPELQATWEQYKDKGVVLLGVAYTDTERNAKAFIEEFGITYPNGLDYKTRISEDYRIQGVPETFVIDRNGKITQFVMYPLNRQELGVMIDRALALP